MYKENDYVVYKKEVCKVREINRNKITVTTYYILVPVDDESLIIDVPTDDRMGYLRDVISQKEAYELIQKMPQIEPLQNIEDRYIERNYKELLGKGTHEDLIKIIKTAYLRNDQRLKNKKKMSEKDSNYFNLAEKYLYNEIAISLNLNFEETKNYILNTLGGTSN